MRDRADLDSGLMDEVPALNTEHCRACGGMGKVMTLDEPPEDPSEGWAMCDHCKGSGLEMSSSSFEVYFVFDDEPAARAFIDSTRGSFRRYGIRRRPIANGPIDTWGS